MALSSWATCNLTSAVPDFYGKLSIGPARRSPRRSRSTSTGRSRSARTSAIAPHVVIYTGSHQLGPGSKRIGDFTSLPVTIEQGAWVRVGAILVPGVTVGRGRSSRRRRRAQGRPARTPTSRATRRSDPSSAGRRYASGCSAIRAAMTTVEHPEVASRAGPPTRAPSPLGGRFVRAPRVAPDRHGGDGSRARGRPGRRARSTRACCRRRARRRRAGGSRSPVARRSSSRPSCSWGPDASTASPSARRCRRPRRGGAR